MPEKDPENTGLLLQVIPFAFAILLSCIGGVVGYLNRLDRTGAAFSFVRLLIEILTSGFVGIISFMLCDAAGFGWSYTAAIVAISGHMGARALFLLENAALIPLLRKYGYDNCETKTARKKHTSKNAADSGE